MSAGTASAGTARTDARRSGAAPPGKGLWCVLVWAFGVIPLAATAFWPRSYGAANYLADLPALASGVPRAVARAGTLSALAVATADLLAALPRGSAGRAGRGLWLGAMAMSAGPLIASAFGSAPTLQIGSFVFPVLATAVYLLPSPGPQWLISQIRAVCLVWIYGSLAAAVVIPNRAVELPYTQGLFPFPPFRLHGLAVQAGQLALVCVLYLTLELRRSHALGKRWWLHSAVACATLVLTAYKSAWLAMTAIMIFHLVSRFSRPALRAAAVVVGLLAISAAFSLGAQDVLSDALQQQRDRVVTLTGRTEVWKITLAIWRENYLFGYGPDLWDVEMARRYVPALGWAPAQAHNQFVQTLGEAGLVGFTGLVVYLMTLIWFGVRLRRVSEGPSFLLVTILLLRSLTDRWYSAGATDGNLFIHFSILSLLFAWARVAYVDRRRVQLSGASYGRRDAARLPVRRT